ncbi:hypothetical protein [Mycetocola tolaasinivorans]|nr:hypothetical protein [Mycetocola tolaasinivorans]
MSDQLAEILTGSFDVKTRVSIFHGTNRITKDPLYPSSWSLNADLEAEVKTSGALTIPYQDPDGRSMLPDGTDGDFSAFRARTFMEMEVTAGGKPELIKLGWGRVVANPPGTEEEGIVNGLPAITSSVIPLTWVGTEETVRRKGFRVPAVPQSQSAWAEVRRLWGGTVISSVPDVAIPPGTVWETSPGGRLRAIQTLGGWLGGRFRVNPSDYLVLVPDKLGPVVATLRLGERGTVTDIDTAVDTREVYNVVAGVYEGADGAPIFAEAEIREGPLDVKGAYGENVLYDSDPAVKTQAQADVRVRRLLDEAVGAQLYRVDVQCVVHPCIEIGDHVAISGWKRPLSGRVMTVGMSDSPLMNLTLEVTRRIT